MVTLSKLELTILAILWRGKEVTSLEIMKIMDEPQPAYSTLSLSLRLLVNKNIIQVKKKSNIGYYSAYMTKEEVLMSCIGDLSRYFFDGDKEGIFRFLMRKNTKKSLQDSALKF